MILKAIGSIHPERPLSIFSCYCPYRRHPGLRNDPSAPIRQGMKVASWNINSVRLRLPLIQQFIRAFPVDILCLQETKVQDELFPTKELNNIGFSEVIFRGEKSYNGVAILSRIPLTEISQESFGGNGQSRHIGAALPNGTELHNFYIPAGGDIPDPEANPKFAHKLQFLDDITAWSAARNSDRPAIIVGDFNIAPLEHDVWSSKQLRNVVSHTDIERTKLNDLKISGQWTDTHRYFTPENEKLYSWWSYRARDWAASDRGRRLDHIWVSPALQSQLKSVATVKEARGWEKPSDHVPVITEFR